MPTDAIEFPGAEFEVNPKDRLGLCRGGSSIGRAPPPGFISAGTPGGWFWDRQGDSIVRLSNEHVLGTTGGIDVAQPGMLDGGRLPADKVGDAHVS